MSPSRAWLLILVLCIPLGVLIYICHGRLNFCSRQGQTHIGDLKQSWGHIEVETGAHIFWWLFYTKNEVVKNVTKIKIQEKPLIIWLQGGPGIAASCYGNFFEIGPLDIHMKERNETWIKHFNVLFLDYPVDVGFSYKRSKATELPKNLQEVGNDLISFANKFFTNFSEFRDVPLYIFGQSYGAKFAVEFAMRLHKEIKSGKIAVNLQGVGSFGGYISPIDFIANYGKVGLTLGMFDEHKYKDVESTVRKIKSALNRGKYKKAQRLEKNLVMRVVEGFDIHNILKPILNIYDNQFKTQQICETVMEDVIRSHLKLNDNIPWNYFNTNCYGVLENELLEGVTEKVEYLLNNTNIKILVFSGMLDYIVNVAGTVDWMRKLQWNGTDQWKMELQTTFPIDDINEAFVRKTDRLALYIVLRAGHSIPMDNPKAVLEILRREILDD